MLDSFKAMGAITGLMKNKDKLEDAGRRIQAELEALRVEGEAGGGVEPPNPMSEAAEWGHIADPPTDVGDAAHHAVRRAPASPWLACPHPSRAPWRRIASTCSRPPSPCSNSVSTRAEDGLGKGSGCSCDNVEHSTGVGAVKPSRCRSRRLPGILGVRRHT